MGDLLLRRRMMMSSNLPGGYTRLMYIESTGTQFIRTGLTHSNHAIIDINTTVVYTDDVIRFAISNYLKQSYLLGFGSYKSAIAGFPQIPFDQTRRIYSFEYRNNIIENMIVGGINYGSSEYSIQTNEEITLFGSGYTSRYISAQCYGVQLFNDGVIVANLIPCRRNSDQTIGMWDTVTKTFLTNAGTGTFIGG